MIARVWRGEATSDNAPRYVDHLEGSVFPKLERLSGHEGAYLLRRESNDHVEFVVLTLWPGWRPSTSSPVTTRALP
jgi:heme-degrading monooxygenase HmoA